MELISFEEAQKILAKYKIAFPKSVFVLPGEVLAKSGLKKNFWDKIKVFKYPVFIKIYGKNIFKRTDIGGVGEAQNKAELEKLFLKMAKIKGTEGIFIQEKVEGKNLVIGMKRDPQFGPVVMAGIGGIFAEVLKDFVLRVAPVSQKEALKMLTELKGYAYLRGDRDNKPINFIEVAKVIVALSDIGLKESQIQDVTLNPVISGGKIASAVDFKLLA